MSGYCGAYFPIDEALRRPRIKALRALRFFDWCGYHDLLVACDVGESERDAFGQGIKVAVARGEIESVGTHRHRKLRLTTKGRATLRDLLATYERNLEAA